MRRMFYHYANAEACAIKLFSAVIYVFVPGKPLQPCLMFVGKARAWPSEAPFEVLHYMVGSWPYPQPQTLD
jgi:hypothetical protein